MQFALIQTEKCAYLPLSRPKLHKIRGVVYFDMDCLGCRGLSIERLPLIVRVERL